MWIVGIEPRLPDLVAGAFTHYVSHAFVGWVEQFLNITTVLHIFCLFVQLITEQAQKYMKKLVKYYLSLDSS